MSELKENRKELAKQKKHLKTVYELLEEHQDVTNSLINYYRTELSKYTKLPGNKASTAASAVTAIAALQKLQSLSPSESTGTIDVSDNIAAIAEGDEMEAEIEEEVDDLGDVVVDDDGEGGEDGVVGGDNGGDDGEGADDTNF